MPNSKQIVYLSQAQYTELIANGSITVNGVTVTYDENDIYVTPQAEPVTDVRVAGTSVATNGVANIPYASSTVAGTVKVAAKNGVQINSNGELQVTIANASHIKNGSSVTTSALTPANAKQVAFYGLSNAAGDTTQQSTTLNDFTYTPEAKGAIQQMLGVSDLIATAENSLVASKAYTVGDVFTANGKLYKATATIAADAAIIPTIEGEEVAGANCEEVTIADGFVKKTDYATRETAGIVKTNVAYGTQMFGDVIASFPCTESYIKSGSHQYNPIVSAKQHQSVFYGLAKAAGADEKDSTLPVGQYTDTAKSAIRTMLGAVGSEDYATTSIGGVVKVSLNNGSQMINGILTSVNASAAEIKTGVSSYKQVNPGTVDAAAFYGLAKASGDTTQSASSNAVGTYTDNAKASIKAMLGIQDGSTGTVDVSGTTPTITAVENTRYVCGEVTSLNFTPAASGICIVRFTSGSTVTVLTLPSTVKFPEWFDPASLETNTIYEICVTDGVYGAVMSWAL